MEAKHHTPFDSFVTEGITREHIVVAVPKQVSRLKLEKEHPR